EAEAVLAGNPVLDGAEVDVASLGVGPRPVLPVAEAECGGGEPVLEPAALEVCLHARSAPEVDPVLVGGGMVVPLLCVAADLDHQFGVRSEAVHQPLECGPGGVVELVAIGGECDLGRLDAPLGLRGDAGRAAGGPGGGARTGSALGAPPLGARHAPEPARLLAEGRRR